MATIRETLDRLSECKQFHLKPVDRSLDIKKIEELKKEVSHHQYGPQLLDEIVNKTLYVPFSTFYDQLITVVSSIEEDKFSILIDIDDPIHSETWCNILVWPVIKNKVVHIFTDFSEINDEYPLLLLDDCIYSGLQITTTMAYISNEAMKVKDCIKCIVVVPYASKYYQTVVSGHMTGRFNNKDITVDQSKLVIEKYYIGNLINFVHSKTIPDKVELSKVEEELFGSYLGSLPLYFDHKIAGSVSCFESIYKACVKTLPDRNHLKKLADLYDFIPNKISSGRICI